MSPLLFHKSLPLLALPFGISLLCLAAALRWRRRWLVAAPLVLLGVFSLPPVSDALMRSIENRFPPVSTSQCPVADAVFPLGGILPPRFDPAHPLELGEPGARFQRALELYFASRAPTLLLSAGKRNRGVPAEGEVLRQAAISRGVPAGDLLMTRETPNTAAEADALREIATARHWRRVLVVTSANHMWRAMRLFRTCPVEIIPVPVDYQSGPPSAPASIGDVLPQAGALAQSERALREYLGVLFYAAAGRK